MPHEDPVLRALCAGRPPWEQVALVAARQGRAMSVRQLRDCGLSRKAIETATAKHILHVVHRGVRVFGTRSLSGTGRAWRVRPPGLAACLSEAAFAAALNEALAKRIVRLPALAAVLDERRGHHGLAALSAAIAAVADEPGRGRPHSELETLVMRRLGELPGLPPYVRNDLIWASAPSASPGATPSASGRRSPPTCPRRSGVPHEDPAERGVRTGRRASTYRACSASMPTVAASSRRRSRMRAVSAEASMS